MLPVMATSPQTSDHDREAADDGTPGNQSIPAMLRGIRSHLAEHVNILAGVRASVETSLSTVMGPASTRYSPGGMTEKRFKTLYNKGDKLQNLSAYLAAQRADAVSEKNNEAIQTLDAVAEDLLDLVALVTDHQDNLWRKKFPAVVMKALNSDLLDPIQGSIQEHVVRARAYALQCVTLYSGQKAGQPFKREAAQDLFNKQIKSMAEKLTAAKRAKEQYDKAYAEMAQLTEEHGTSEIVESPLLSKRMQDYKNLVATFTQSMNALRKDVITEFSGGTYGGNAEGTLKLNIPSDSIELTKGQDIRQEIPTWYKNHAKELYPVIPYIGRILNDYDPLKGEYWKPPTEIEAEGMVPEGFLDEWKAANLALAGMIWKDTSAHIQGQLVSTFYYGANQNKSTRVDHQDGLSLMFALITLTSPNTSEYRDNVDRQMHGCADLAASGNPSDFVKTVRGILAEAVRLNLPVKWHIGRKIINILSDRNQLFARELGPMADSCPNHDDSAEYMDSLLTKIEGGNSQIKAVNGDSWWVSTPRAHLSTAWKGTPDEYCRFGNECRNKDNGQCDRDHSRKRGKGSGKGKGKGKTKGKTPKYEKTNKTAKAGRCTKKDCTNTKSPHGDLCMTCWSTAKLEGSYTNLHGKRVMVTTAGKVKKAKAEANTAQAAKAQPSRPKTAIEEIMSAEVTISASDYAQLIKNQKKVNESEQYANAMSVTGEILTKFITGPASYKQQKVEEYMSNNYITGQPLKDTIDNFRSYLSNE